MPNLRSHAVTRGLTAEMVVLPHEIRWAFENELRGWVEDWQPRSQTRMALVERAAVESWRLRRCVRAESARLAEVADKAGVAYDSDRKTKFDRGLQLLTTQPREALRLLQADVEGRRFVINAWRELHAFVEQGPAGWDDYANCHGRLMTLLGHPSSANPNLADEVGRASIRLVQYNRGDLPHFDKMKSAEAHRIATNLATWTKEMADDLAERSSKDLNASAARSRAMDKACVDASPESVFLHRYESSLDRSFKATIRLLTGLAKSGCDLIAPNEANDGEPNRFSPIEANDPEPTRISPNKPTEPESTRISPNKATDPGPILHLPIEPNDPELTTNSPNKPTEPAPALHLPIEPNDPALGLTSPIEPTDAAFGLTSPIKPTDLDLIPISPNKPTDAAPTPISPNKPTDAAPTPISPNKPTDAAPTPISPNKPTDAAPRADDRDRDGRLWGVQEDDPSLIDK